MSNTTQSKQEQRITRVLAQSVGEYELRVEGFTDWVKALLEIGIGAFKIELVELLQPVYSAADNLVGVAFPQVMDGVEDRLLVLFLLCHPSGATQDNLQALVQAPVKTVRNWLTENSKGLAGHLQKVGTNYSLRSESISWALNSAKEILDRCA